jgi:hypothetical protein
LNEKRKLDEFMTQKEKVSEQMQGLMLAFEEAKNQKIG